MIFCAFVDVFLCIILTSFSTPSTTRNTILDVLFFNFLMMFLTIKTANHLNEEFLWTYNFEHFGRPKTPFPPCEWGRIRVGGGR